MTERPTSWHPTEAEVERMVAEMRPLLAELARQARLGCQGQSPAPRRGERRSYPRAH